MVCQPENEPMRRLARKIGIRLAYDEGEVIGHLRLPAPDPLSAQAEFAIEAANVIGRWATLEVPPAAS